MSDTKTPLWKQLIGASVGAMVAFALYEGYSFASGHLQALVTLPTAPGVTHQDQLRFSAKEGAYNQARLEFRQQQIAATHGTDTPSTVQRHFMAQKIVVVPDDTVVVPTESNSPQRVEITGSLNAPAPSAIPTPSVPVSVSSSSSSPSTLYPGLAFIRRFGQSSSASSSVAIQIQAMAVSSSAQPTIITDVRHTRPSATLSFPGETYATGSASSPINRNRTFVQNNLPTTTADAVSLSPEAPVETQKAATFSSAAVWTAEAPYASTATASAEGSQTHLPQTGFGLDILAVTAIGAAIGRKRSMRKAKTL